VTDTRRFVFMLLAGVLIFVGLPILGWGVGDIGGFFAHPARLGYVVLMILLQIFVALRFPGVGRSGGKGMKLVQRQQAAVALMQVFSLAIVIFAPFSDRHDFGALGGGDWLRYVGLVLFAAGFLLMNWSEATLGRLFSVQVTVQENHRLITGGPYRYVRNPRYLGIILFNLGVSLVFRSWLALILTAALAVVLLWRIQDEEALMRQEFGEEWDAYARQSWHLIPFLY
jgi:protein-S-isoprenylcysteine O-methyltransferase Ste14